MDSEPETRLQHVSLLGNAVQSECAPEDSPGAVMLGFVVVSEWVDTEGNQTLTKVFADPRGRPPTPWRVLGWLEWAARKFS